MVPHASNAISDGEIRLVWEPVGFAYVVVGTVLTEEATTEGTYVGDEVCAPALAHRSAVQAIAGKAPAKRNRLVPEDTADNLAPGVGRPDSSSTFSSDFLKEAAVAVRMERLKMISNKWSSRKSRRALFPSTESI
jgi:hypothetical protein